MLINAKIRVETKQSIRKKKCCYRNIALSKIAELEQWPRDLLINDKIRVETKQSIRKKKCCYRNIALSKIAELEQWPEDLRALRNR